MCLQKITTLPQRNQKSADKKGDAAMKIILSRKGFDSSSGGFASPIFPDGTMLSLPIPVQEMDASCTKYSDIRYSKYTYQDILEQLNPRRSNKMVYCHLDPDIRSDIWKNSLPYWRPAFGQIGAAETHLQNHNVQAGDLFLFFGWFREVEADYQGKWKYTERSPDIQAIYGYLQIGQIIRGQRISEFSWHPHATTDFLQSATNTLYAASDRLVIDGLDYEVPGSGVLSYNPRLVLTKIGLPRSCWRLHDWMKNVEISYHSRDCVHENEQYFQSRARGQEFVVEENHIVTQWATSLILGR